MRYPEQQQPEQHSGQAESNVNLPANVRHVSQAVARRRLGRAALLFLAAHQPAAFLMGHFLYFLSPAYRLLAVGSQAESLVDDWAAVFCREDGLRTLETVLLDGSERSASGFYTGVKPQITDLQTADSQTTDSQIIDSPGRG
jgi:hypothetical protein